MYTAGKGRARARRAFATLVATVAALAAAGPASASVTGSTITSPSDPFYAQADYITHPSQPVTITGTATTNDGNASDAVDIVCTYQDNDGAQSATIKSNVPVGSDGSFQTTVDVSALEVNNGDTDYETIYGQLCRLRAVDHSNWNGDYQPFNGPRVDVGEKDLYNRSEGSTDGSNGQISDFYSSAGSDPGWGEYYSIGSGGLYGDYPFDPNTFLAPYYQSWYGAGALYGHDQFSRSEILVDGHFAYDSYAAATLYSTHYNSPSNHTTYSRDNANFPDITGFSSSVDPATGNLTIHESEPLVRCATDTYDATNDTCGGSSTQQGSFIPTGVTINRTIVQDHGGRVSTITDSFTSTDPSTHNVDAEYDNNAHIDEGAAWKMPGSDQYTQYSQGDSGPLGSGAPGTIFVRDNYDPDNYYGDSDGSLTFTTQPNYAKFSGNNQLLLDYQFGVPAGGSTPITQIYGWGNNTTDTEAQAAAIENTMTIPAVAIGSPGNGTTFSQSRVTVTGTASARHGLSSFTVNGVAVPVDANGVWSTELTLAPGNNTITAVATNGAGRSAQAQETVAYLPPSFPAAALACNAVNVQYMSLSQAANELRGNHCLVGKVTTKRTSAFPAGRVIGQSVAQTGLPFDTKVNLTVAAKPKAVKKHKKKHKKKKHKKSTKKK